MRKQQYMNFLSKRMNPLDARRKFGEEFVKRAKDHFGGLDKWSDPVFYRVADVVYQDCETSPFKSGVHAHYEDLKTLPGDIKSKMHLCHCNPDPTQDPVADGFAGFIKKGQVFEYD